MINYLIESENSTDHWPYFDSTNHNVLDLGCGRWYTDIKEELSPFYFGKNANLVVGIDSNNFFQISSSSSQIFLDIGTVAC